MPKSLTQPLRPEEAVCKHKVEASFDFPRRHHRLSCLALAPWRMMAPPIPPKTWSTVQPSRGDTCSQVR